MEYIYRLMLGDQIIGDYHEEIIYDETQKAWNVPPYLYCDTDKHMHVIKVDKSQVELEQAITKATTIEVTRV